MNKMHEELISAMESLDEDIVIGLVKQLLKEGASNISIMDSLNTGMSLVGNSYESGAYYLADLIVSGSIYRQALGYLRFDRSSSGKIHICKIVIGVVQNDIHDIGKDIVISTLLSDGFEVIDLGTDVKCEDFITAIKEHKPDILALSGTMSFALDEMQHVIHRLEETGLRDTVKIIAGGLCVNKNNAKRIGADYYSKDPIEAIATCRKMI